MDRFRPIVDAIDKLIEEGKVKKFDKDESLETYVKYSLNGKKMFNVDKKGHKDGWVYFHFENAYTLAKQLNIDFLYPISKQEAQQYHLGRARAVYKGQNFEIIKKMIKHI